MQRVLAIISLAAAIMVPGASRAVEGCVAATGVNAGHCAYAPTTPGGYLAAADHWSIDARNFFGDVVAHFGSDVGSDPVAFPGTVPLAYAIEAQVYGTGTIIVGNVP